MAEPCAEVGDGLAEVQPAWSALFGGKLVVANEPHSPSAAQGIAGGAEACVDGPEPAKAKDSATMDAELTAQ